MLQVGQPFPSFSLSDQDGKVFSNEELKGERAVVYFYPKDDTSGCTAQACSLQEHLAEIPGAKVFGVSPDPVKSHRKFANKFNLTFPLLADTEKALCEACGVWVEKSMYGRKYMGVARTTFLLDENGVVTHVMEKVDPKTHTADVIAALGRNAE